MLISTPLEIVLIVRQHYIQASGIYAASDVARTVFVVGPALLHWGLRGVFWGAVVFTVLRLCLTLALAQRGFHVDFKIDVLALRRHLGYAAPFALWVVADIASTTMPQYLVANRFDAATFAIFSVGCLQIPFVDFVLASAGTVMMVKMGEALREGRTQEVITLWHDTTRKLGMILFPMVALLILLARELITFLFTANYSASAPLFMLWCLLIVLAAVPIEGVLRSFAETRPLLWFSIVRVLIIATCGIWGLKTFGLAGIILTTVVAAAIYKLLGLYKLKSTVRMGVRELLPWASMANTLLCASVAVLPALLVRVSLGLPLVPLMVVMSTLYFISYVALAHLLNLINVRDLLESAFKAFRFRTQLA
ncbi:MAG: oligosaccharide flippase family protein [Deltaproteobacteria bacterium]|nr:oligosaccharide flippase family protein [Deltaproteobacteria bacterium]